MGEKEKKLIFVWTAERGGHLGDLGDVVGWKMLGASGIISLGFPRFILAGSVKLPPEKQLQVSTSTSYILDKNELLCLVIVKEIMAYLSQRPIKRLLIANR